MPAVHATVHKKSVHPAKREAGPVVGPRQAETATVDGGIGSCPCGGGCPRCRAAQPSAPPAIEIGSPHDAAEHEAERAATQIMHLPLAADTGAKADFSLSRDSAAPSAFHRADAPPIVPEVLASPGQALPGDARADMEARFGRSFSGTRVHTGAPAARSAAAVDAHAYTVGNDIVFGAGRYIPHTLAGRHLLAHELAHVAQNESGSAGALTLRRVPVTRDLTSVPQYEWTGREQRRTANNVSPAYVSLSFEPTTGIFTCTFRLRWRFPAGWAEPRRAAYIESFVNVVTAAWQDKFPLVRFDGRRATTDIAHVHLAFDSVRAPDMSGTNDDTAYVNWLLTPAGAATHDRWTMNVHDSFQYRDRVDAPGVHLDPGSNTSQQHDTSSYTDTTYTNLGSGGQIQAPPYQHYFDRGITPGRGPARGGTYTQTASAHEFGHMIGLADEYVMSAEDYHDAVAARGQAAANAELRRRRSASARIQNIGGQVTRDAYRPFADFLSTLTGQDWRVQ